MATLHVSDSQNKRINDSFSFKAQVTKSIGSHVLTPKINKNGTLVFPNKVPDDIKEWIKNG